MAHRTFMQSKLHAGVITEARLDYEGSISIDKRLLDLAGMAVHEQVDVYNLDNGERLTTYILEGGPGEICLNGAAAHKGKPGERVIIVSYIHLAADEIAGHSPTVVLLNSDNTPKTL